ncbi:hypothetical protein J7F03_30245 [Streptomyces sp. ISL-43]|uniref:DUF6197 family protein n=1 Tax=Streptomyces sp. ISL-43 TaxID=2819183 RepID=UPI001BEA2568|nr:hypothetical protein [Streptomyces sp. ISL-43]MBT2451275.1 hypothetical protein [Streptomyces sp. ISL-43]
MKAPYSGQVVIYLTEPAYRPVVLANPWRNVRLRLFLYNSGSGFAMTPAKVLRAAANIIECHGLNKGSAFAYPRMRRTGGATWEQLIEDAVTRAPVSVEGAMERAIWGQVQRFDSFRFDTGEFSELIEARNYFCDWLTWTRGITNLSASNDDPDTTPEMLAFLLRTAADDWTEPPF